MGVSGREKERRKRRVAIVVIDASPFSIHKFHSIATKKYNCEEKEESDGLKEFEKRKRETNREKEGKEERKREVGGEDVLTA